MSEKNVLFLIHRLSHGGAEKIISSLSKLIEDSYNVYIISFDCTDKVYETGGKLIDLSIGASSNSILRFFNLIKKVHQVKNIKKQLEIDCTISFLIGPNLVNLLSKYNDKVVLSVRTYLSGQKVNKSKKILSEYIYNKADCTVAISKLVEKDLMSNFNIKENKLRTIYNPCDIKKICCASAETNDFVKYIDKTKFNFVTVGRFHEAKGQWHLIRAFSALCKEEPNSHLYMIGEGELEEKLADLIDKLGINENVTFTGFLKNPHCVVNGCNAFVFSSLYEGFGNVIVEALALGKPVISSDCFTGPRTILAPKTDIEYQARSVEYAEFGVLVPAGKNEHFNAIDPLSYDEKCMYSAMKEIIHNDSLRNEYTERAYKRAMDFSCEKTKLEWIRLIEELTEKE